MNAFCAATTTMRPSVRTAAPLPSSTPSAPCSGGTWTPPPRP
jgi:hypothetical protein